MHPAALAHGLRDGRRPAYILSLNSNRFGRHGSGTSPKQPKESLMRAPKQIFTPATALALLGAAALAAAVGPTNPAAATRPPPSKVVTLRAQQVTLTRELPGHTSAFLVARSGPR